MLEKDFYNMDEAAEILGCSKRTLYNQRHEDVGAGKRFFKPSAGKLRISIVVRS